MDREKSRVQVLTSDATRAAGRARPLPGSGEGVQGATAKLPALGLLTGCCWGLAGTLERLARVRQGPHSWDVSEFGCGCKVEPLGPLAASALDSRPR